MFTQKKISLKHYLEVQIDIKLWQSRRISRQGQRIKKRDGQIFILSDAFVTIVKPQFDSSPAKLVPFNYLIGAS